MCSVFPYDKVVISAPPITKVAWHFPLQTLFSDAYNVVKLELSELKSDFSLCWGAWLTQVFWENSGWNASCRNESKLVPLLPAFFFFLNKTREIVLHSEDNIFFTEI